ncbi:methyl-accepting chemotaxis protein [Desulfofundulus salinus]|uniref:Chemotaxis protein n=1 Tax=Desulfofundulus salinus TaxID=2419843 RepID=A0A494WYK1_9FIRM|nr:methyl-accepting chemotaxis protein [Desulfofundulus salinum]RKO67412.1 chemotaxis protein [Desulfofundulus salinum]
MFFSFFYKQAPKTQEAERLIEENFSHVSVEEKNEGSLSLPSRDLLSYALELAPFIKGLLGEEVGLYVSNLEQCIYCNHGSVRLPLKAGDAFGEGSATALALKKRQRVVMRVGKEVYGIPYIGIAYPITDPATGKVVGALAITSPIDRQEDLMAAAEKMEDQVNTIATAITNLSATTEELAATTENLNSTAQALKDEVRKTDSIVNLIRDIAEETHMLGLNAAIEAARVGDAGRGFNVVAGEIRNLSQNTQRSAKEVMQALQEIQRSILDLTHAIEQISAAAQQQAASTQEISAAVNELSNLTVVLKKQANELVR